MLFHQHNCFSSAPPTQSHNLHESCYTIIKQALFYSAPFLGKHNTTNARTEIWLQSSKQVLPRCRSPFSTSVHHAGVLRGILRRQYVKKKMFYLFLAQRGFPSDWSEVCATHEGIAYSDSSWRPLFQLNFFSSYSIRCIRASLSLIYRSK
jgi:hypothetical protein